MSYARFDPTPPAAPWIQSIWVQESTVDASLTEFAPTRVLPTGFVDIAFYFRDPFFHVGPHERDVLPAATVTGPLTRYREYGALGKTGLVLVRLRRMAASAVLGCDLHELQDADVDLRAVIGTQAARDVENRVQSAPNNRRRVAAINRFVVDRVGGARRDRLVQNALQYILQRRGRVIVREMAHALARSPRQVERSFQNRLGLSPKMLIRIVRFQRAVRLRKRGAAWSAAAYECGYSDQAHLCNEFAQLAGLSPNVLLARTARTSLAQYFNRDSATSHFCNTLYA